MIGVKFGIDLPQGEAHVWSDLDQTKVGPQMFVQITAALSTLLRAA